MSSSNLRGLALAAPRTGTRAARGCFNPPRAALSLPPLIWPAPARPGDMRHE
jgi:hypothetical protein